MTTFPKDFLWGASISAHQTEGAYATDGKGLSVQDTRPRDNKDICDFTVASDFYHNYKEDIRLLHELGLKVFRFSIAWTRIFPTGVGLINPEGVTHYHDVIDTCLSYGIQPMITLYHFDLPQSLEDTGGWSNRATVNAFEDYARFLFTEYGSKVKYWLTINEPNIMLLVDKKILGKHIPLKEKYQQFHHIMIAEKLAFKACHELVEGGQIGPVPNISIVYPATSKPLDNQASLYFNSIRNWLYLDFACKGIYNPIALDYLRQKDVVPQMEPGDDAIMKSAYPDFISVNYYSSVTVEYPEADVDMMDGISDQQSEDIMEKGFYKGYTNTFLTKNEFNWTIDPLGLKTTMQHINDRYALPMMITENGLGAYDTLENGEIHDDYRIAYIREHLKACLEAMSSGITLLGYSPWSAIDLVSVHEGMQKRYGFIFVDRTEKDEKQLKRYRKDSFYWYQDIIKTHGETLQKEK
ncbi:glycoside hydrolase family 1 protein [Erysipelothrix sp. HDW6C]|uniref:glycoside hydrolase family 1 protein n=1 Tax=Erysipelothrix sp. HDW6C TaxID=2714930 RepID=UPI00140B53AD|nr:glycoside hydrolase family 1 protein [Erysipelothrix sp. HDW6C]QIK68833.1 glycoside hydrolase family 1 protein [Erysipelothrix sp. HDW6C]